MVLTTWNIDMIYTTLGVAQGRGEGMGGWVGGGMDIRGVYRFSSLMK
jgi:hypothetical protein